MSKELEDAVRVCFQEQTGLRAVKVFRLSFDLFKVVGEDGNTYMMT